MKFDETLTQCVMRNLKTDAIPMLLGEPGIGKSSWVMALAKRMRTECFVLACNQLADKADLTGARLVPHTDKNGNTTYSQVFYPHQVIHDAIEYAESHPRETPILFMDELNRTTPDVTSECLSIPTLRAIGSTKLPSNLKVITAGNDKGNITTLDEASISRFVLYHVTPDVSTFLGLDSTLNPFVRKVLENHPETIFGKTINITASTQKKDDDDDSEPTLDQILGDDEGMQQIATPRTISALSRFLNEYTNQELLSLLSQTQIVDGAESNILQEIIFGYTGETLFSIQLLDEIAKGITTVTNQSNSLAIAKPNCYDQLRVCTTVDEMNDLIANMSDSDRSGCLAYALYEKADNSLLIRTLAPHTATFVRNDLNAVTTLAMSDQLDQENVAAFMSTGTPLANNMTMFFAN